MTSSGKSVQPNVPGMISMELPHIQLISEVTAQPIFINDPPNLQHRRVFVMPSFLQRIKKWQKY